MSSQLEDEHISKELVLGENIHIATIIVCIEEGTEKIVSLLAFLGSLACMNLFQHIFLFPYQYRALFELREAYSELIECYLCISGALGEAHGPLRDDKFHEDVRGDDVQRLLVGHLMASRYHLIFSPFDSTAKARDTDDR